MSKYGQHAEPLQTDSSSPGINFSFVLFGVAVGTAMALLLSPKSGSDVRGDIRRGVDNAKSKSSDLLGNVRGRVLSFRSQPREQVDDPIRQS